jgi:hypothetical protein
MAGWQLFTTVQFVVYYFLLQWIGEPIRTQLQFTMFVGGYILLTLVHGLIFAGVFSVKEMHT